MISSIDYEGHTPDSIQVFDHKPTDAEVSAYEEKNLKGIFSYDTYEIKEAEVHSGS